MDVSEPDDEDGFLQQIKTNREENNKNIVIKEKEKLLCIILSSIK